MKMKIFESTEKRVLVRLIDWDVDSVALVVVDEDGRRLRNGTILVLQSDGLVRRSAGIDPDLGFQLDDQGRIYTTEDVPL